MVRELSTSTDDEDRFRTPSGTEFPNKVADIRNYFVSNSHTMSEESIKEKVKMQSTETPYRKGRQGIKKVKCKSLNGDDENSVRVKHGTVSQSSEDEEVTSMSDSSMAPQEDQSMSNQNDEDVFLLTLAKLIKPISDEQLEKQLGVGVNVNTSKVSDSINDGSSEFRSQSPGGQ